MLIYSDIKNVYIDKYVTFNYIIIFLYFYLYMLSIYILIILFNLCEYFVNEF